MKLVRVAQMPGMPPMGGPPMGAPPMGPMGPGMPGAMPMANPVEPKREEIGSPLDSVAKILYDADITSMIEGSAGADEPEDLAMDIWVMYGGTEKGSVDFDRTGARHDQKNVSPEDEEAEREATDDERWLRLPAGKTIADVTSLDELTKVMKGLTLGTVKNMAKQQGGAPGGPGGMPPMGGPPPGGPMGGPPPGGAPMASAKVWKKIAHSMDSRGLYEAADFIDGKILS